MRRGEQGPADTDDAKPAPGGAVDAVADRDHRERREDPGESDETIREGGGRGVGRIGTHETEVDPGVEQRQHRDPVCAPARRAPEHRVAHPRILDRGDDLDDPMTRELERHVGR